MPEIRLLDNPIRNYAWGSRTVLASLQGRSVPSAEPEAELWVGSHPAAPSYLENGGRRMSLLDWIRRDPVGNLGEGVARRFDGELPFLLKILAVDQPLSLQAHPDESQAREGFAREERDGPPIDAPDRNYRDPHHKPELVCALGPFRALKGFRPVQDILGRVAALGVSALDGWLERLGNRPDAAGWKHAFEELVSMPRLRAEPLVDDVVRATRARGEADPSLAWVGRLAEAHPGDLGALAPLYLHFIDLGPGEALFLPAGELHCHLEGVAVEIMANSDNVLRGGLTPKHIDVPELLRVMRFDSADPSPAAIVREGQEHVYRTGAREFELRRVEMRSGEPYRPPPDPGACILLCADGACRLGAELQLTAGAAAWIPAGAAISARGAATLYRARVADPA